MLEGAVASAFTLPLLDGKSTLRLADMKGVTRHPVVLDAVVSDVSR